jgi:hypothetical protein
MLSHLTKVTNELISIPAFLDSFPPLCKGRRGGVDHKDWTSQSILYLPLPLLTKEGRELRAYVPRALVKGICV